MKYELTKTEINKYENKFNLNNYQLNEFKYGEFKLTDFDLHNLLNIDINPNLLFEIREFYEYSDECRNYMDNHGCTINEELMYSLNPAMLHFSYYNNIKKFHKNDLEEYEFNPYTIDDAIQNNINYNFIDYYMLLSPDFPIIYDYIISKDFYNLIIKYKKLYPAYTELFDIWLNINPYSEDILFNEDILNLDILSLNPNCFAIFEKYKKTGKYNKNRDYLNDEFLSINPYIIKYKYEEIKEKNQYINEELIRKLHRPELILKFLENGNDIEDYLN